MSVFFERLVFQGVITFACIVYCAPALFINAMDVDQDYDRLVRQQREANARVLMQLDLKGSVEDLMQECLRSR
ncbi:hypothetical protein DUNSADRAFT_1585 [Dunaliella salina]|uniref:Uncharacterized protein n=1 Tax=Dunaliella salina TaxID=3046 RepID=A0ABQ7H8H6_DUNSA|nr:hypothetical protein DUNSADRAFT_1585 [Dunaliella salina]|eukprot:KAF5843158.1 hypothetical protein DUNSADRAFT_1585 [Dunaliella salina]